jgi:propanol-preferring alcohol dehydrogenase
VPGHQVVGRVDATGEGAARFKAGERVGVGWIFSACGQCAFCRGGRENLCGDFKGTGRDADGGYQEYMLADERFTVPIPGSLPDTAAAPLLCAGAVGYRSLRLCGHQNGEPLGLTGFGASGHLVLKAARHLYPHSPVFVFARDAGERAFARSLGAAWAGESAAPPPALCRSIIDTTPVWKTVVDSLAHLQPGGRLVINAIRKESADQDALLNLSYAQHFWMEKEIKSVANVTRRDLEEFLTLAAHMGLKPETALYRFERANESLLDLKNKPVRGAKVLTME